MNIKNHNLRISKRLHGLINENIAKKYTVEDILMLSQMLYDDNVCPNKLNIRDYIYDYPVCSNCDDLTENIDSSNPLTAWEHTTVNLEIDINRYLLIFYTRVFIFLVRVPLKLVPTYLNTDLNIYAVWRLRINK